MANTTQSRLGGLGSAIAYTSDGDRYVMLPDRGPGDGGSAYLTRIQFVSIPIPRDLSVGRPVATIEPTVVDTRVFHDADGAFYPGNSGAYSVADPANSRRYDPEGIRVGSDGILYVSDEYGPHVDVFGIDGVHRRRLSVPGKYGIAVPDGIAENELPPRILSGRQPNRGFEGLAVSPDGATLTAILQSPLIQDSALDAANARRGRNIRVLQMRTEGGGPAREWVYRLDHPKLGVSEILAIDANRFLTIERDGKVGSEAMTKCIHIVDARDATDVSSVVHLPPDELPPTIRAATKTRFLDLLDARFGLAGPEMPEKIEGLTFGPSLDDGRRTLLVTTDNDFKDTESTWIWVFAFDASDLDP